jgi:SAM-dependent methyltransferase
MESDSLYNDPELAQFYDIENAWTEDLTYCRNLARGRLTILDLGCGTGLLAASLAQEDHRLVVGVDPAKPMLDLAERRSGGERVRWIQDDARSLRLGQCFDLVLLTGHAFQVFLTPQDQSAVLRTIASHLAPEGCFIFDTRNPAAEAWKRWTPTVSKRLIEHSLLGQVLAWNDVSQDLASGVVTYGTYYKCGTHNRVYSARSKIAFPSRDQLSPMMHDANLVVETWLGDWQGGPWGPVAPEIIPLGKLR